MSGRRTSEAASHTRYGVVDGGRRVENEYEHSALAQNSVIHDVLILSTRIL